MQLTSFLHESHDVFPLHEGWTLELAGGSPPEGIVLPEQIPAHLPGTVHTDLMRAGILPDPFHGMNEREVAWVAECDWRYRLRFSLPEGFPAGGQGQRRQLLCEGLDTVARVELDGILLGERDNMFVTQRFDLPDELGSGEHELLITFTSPLAEMRRRVERGGRAPMDLGDDRGWLRKAQYSFGWDWGPELPTSGIFRPIGLQAWREGRIGWLNPRFEPDGEGGGRLEIDVELALEQAGDWSILAGLRSGHSDHAASQRVEVDASGDASARLSISLPEAQLWWPQGMGDPVLYDLELELCLGEDVVHRVEEKIGLRTVEWKRERDEWGESFFVQVNGRPLFAKGANWIPSDSFLPRVSAERLERQVDLAVEAGMNMLRVWGGGRYEDDAFYRACDRRGVLVWQDFPFACSFYPQSPAFLESVKEEAEAVIAQLARHPSLALWCGNNEIERDAEKFMARWDLPYLGKPIWSEVLPEVVARLDAGRFYWESSPNGLEEPNGELSGDRHVWSVWSGWQGMEAYLREEARFVSEFGFQAMPHPATLRAALPPGEHHPQEELVEWHNKQVYGPERLWRFLTQQHRATTDFDRFSRLTQDVQGRAFERALLHWRRRRPRSMGALIWQFNDCWPVASWSIIDYALRPKASWYRVRRALAPQALALLPDSERWTLAAINDADRPWQGELRLRLLSFTGDVLAKLSRPLEVAPDGVQLLDDPFDGALAEVDPSNTLLVAELDEPQGLEALPVRSVAVMKPSKYLELSDPGIELVPSQVAGQPGVRLSCRAAALGVWIEDRANPDLSFSDNALDLLPGQERWLATRHAVSGEPLDVVDPVAHWIGEPEE